MAGPSWLMDKSRLATDIKCASGAAEEVTWKTNPTITCPNCQHVIDNSDVSQEWPGLPKGVKFDPSDQEIMWHLLAKVGAGNSEPHPFIDEFITTLEDRDGICSNHPQRLPGISQDGSASHFFHKVIQANFTSNRKRRKICGGKDCGDFRWHKTGKTRPILLNGIPKGCKKIMVLYTTQAGGGKTEKTNWIMHQYHVGTEDDEKGGEYVVSKVFYQQQQVKFGENDDQIPETTDATKVKAGPVTPSTVTPEAPPNEKQCSGLDQEQEFHHFPQILPNLSLSDSLFDIQYDDEMFRNVDLSAVETENNEGIDDIENNADEFSELLGSDSLDIMNSQQLVEGLPLWDTFSLSQSPKRYGENGEQSEQPSFSIYSHLWSEQLKKDMEECQNLGHDTTQKNYIEECQNLGLDTKQKNDINECQNLGLNTEMNKDINECQNLDLDTSNVELDTQASDIRLSQLTFSSQDSYIAWGGSKIID